MTSKQNPYDRQYFENIFSRQVHNSQRNRRRLELARQVVPCGNFLEIGCGQGEFLRMAADYYAVEGIDISRHAVTTLRRSTNLPIQHADIQDADIPVGRYNGVAAFNVLEHLMCADEVLGKIYASLRPGGALFGSVPFNSHILGSVHTQLTNIFDRTHVATYTPSRWRALFQESGFSQVRFSGEVMFGKNGCVYVQGRGWEWIALNLVFCCRK